MSQEQPPPTAPPADAPREEEEEGVVKDILKRAIQQGFRTVRWGEESLRGIASDIIHNERVEAVGSTLNSIREDLVRVVGREFVRYLDRMNLTDEIVKVLTAISLELKTEIRFIPNDKKLVTPDVKASVSVKRTADKKPRKRKRKKKTNPEPEPAE